MLAVKCLEVCFEGYFMCRVATDPDPANEQRGVSGYTIALATEDALDQVIRLQEDVYVVRNLRDPARDMGRHVGVTVRKVLYDGRPFAEASGLHNAKVYLLGETEFTPGPIFESRNNLVGADNTMAFVINPFHLRIVGHGASIDAIDYLNPADPAQRIWHIGDPHIYGRRLPAPYVTNTQEVKEAIGVFDFYGYFRDRRRYLAEQIDHKEQEHKRADIPRQQQLQAEIQGLHSRLFQIESWGDRVSSKLGFQLSYEFSINGSQAVDGALGGNVDLQQPWRVRFWFGGWDGDLLLGYMRGSLQMPFSPDVP